MPYLNMQMRKCDVIKDLAVNELLNMATGQYVIV